MITLPLLAVALWTFVVLAWLFELRHREEALPTLGNRRHVAPFAIAMLATLFATPVVLWPLISVAEWPRATQVAWTAVEPADRASRTLAIGGAEHSAMIAWPNGNFRPELRIERTGEGRFRLLTRGGTALVRVDGAYANGDVVTLGGGAKQIGRFAIELKRRGLLRTAKVLISRTPVAEPLIVMDPPEAHPTRARSLESLFVARLNDLRRDEKLDLATVHALEAWAGAIRVLMPNESELRLVQDHEPWREASVAKDSATVEILWPRRRLVMRLTEAGGAPRLSFAPPWTRTTSLPPFEKGASTLAFARQPSAGTNTFLLPLGHGAAEFRHDTALVLSSQDQPRFRDGRDLALRARGGSPRWLNRLQLEALGEALQPNRSLSSVTIPMVVASRARGLLLTITIVRDLPTPKALLLALALGWALLALFVASIAFGRVQRLRIRDFWCLAGVIVAIWMILLVRVLLAVRYLLTPTAIDEVTAKGLAGTLAALVIVPGFIALAVRLWLHHRPGLDDDARSTAITVLVAIALVAGSVVQFVVMPMQVLPNLATLWTPSYFDRLLLVVYAVAALAIFNKLWWQLPYRITFDAGRKFWQALSPGQTGVSVLQRHVIYPARRVVAALRTPDVKRYVLIWIIGMIAIMVLARVAPAYVRQIIAPFWMIGIPALILLSRPVASADDAMRVLDATDGTADVEPSLADTIAAVVLLMFVPLALMLGILADFGAIYTVLAFWFPLALLLLLTPASRLAATLLVVLTAGVAVAYWALLGTYAIAPGMTEHILSRVEVMKHGSSAQEWLLDLEAPSASDAKAVTAANVRNALVHEWEHMALVRKGGWRGLGFNRAPASQSFIRQDTIQYDSVYSFFVSGEHGMIGGVALLTIFAAPVVLLLMRRTQLRVGDMLAIAIAAAFFGEAVAHAAMNVAQVWFSGRNLPLLATASHSDLLRWALELALMCQAMLWSSGLRAGTFDMLPETVVTRRSIVDPAFAHSRTRLIGRLVIGAVIVGGLAVTAITRDIAWLAFALAVPIAMALRKRENPALAILPALLVAVLVVRGSVRAVRSDEFDVLTWSRLLRRVDELHATGMLRYDEKRRLVLFCDASDRCTERPTGATLLEAEVLRFNSLPVHVRMDGGRQSLPAGFFDGLTDPGAYGARLFELWERDTERVARMRPSVFSIERTEETAEGVPQIGYRVTGNPDYNIVHSFSDARDENEVQPVSTRGVQLLGRAWAMGRWVYAPTKSARELGLGWMGQVGDALLRVPQQRRAAMAELTIDANLQRITQATVDAAGRDLHSRLIAQGAANPLPPRVALTVLRGTTGEVLAMGSWPRAAEDDDWSSRRVSFAGRSWIEREPPFSWLTTTAPRPIASRHSVDHNFAAIEMGSAAKPFWATAALTVHPRLDDLLWVRNGECDQVVEDLCYERKLFGAEIGRGWQVSETPRWIDFDTYLAASDNRYHTRLGFLGLARSNGNAIADDGLGLIRSGRESLTGRGVAWNRYPALPDAVEHTRDKAESVDKLHEQRLAILMRDLFGVRVGTPPPEGELRRRHVSFWTANESDDLRVSEGLEPLAVVSPDAVDLRLDGVRRTRDFVAVLLGGSTSRWSNVAAAAAFSSWAMRRPVIAHVVAKPAEGKPLPSRAAAFDDPAKAAATRVRNGLRRVLDDGTAVRIRGRMQPLRDRYEVYVKTGTLATIDPKRPTSRILIVIIDRAEGGQARNAITLSFVAERATMGFATEQIGAFVHNHMAELLRLLEAR